MKFIFDVDHTLFDTEKFSQDAEPYKADGTWVTPRIWDILDARDYIYPDVIETLSKLGKDNVELLTAITPELGPESELFQKMKLEKSGLMDYATRTTFMVGLKGEHVKEITKGESAVFADDRTEQIDSVRELAPHVLSILMVRKSTFKNLGFEGMVNKLEKYQARDLNEMLLLVESWETELQNQ